MQTIKSFIYLDEYKMYSISSQIFEGITESLMSYQESATEKQEEQKGEIGSGRIISDEVQMPIEPYIFSSNFNREYLREDEHLLVRKYSRFAEKEFVLFGTVAQSSDEFMDHEETDEDDNEFQHIKEVIMSLVEQLSVVESTFSGKLANEIIIDPIALYREV